MSSALIPPRAAARVLITQALLAAVVGLTFLYFYAGLQRDPQPHHIPFAITGGPAAQGALRELGAVVDVSKVADDAAARQAVISRHAVAALSFHGSGEVSVYVAAANGAAENTAAEQIAGGVAQRTGSTPHIVDLVPTVRYDPRGLASFYIALAATVSSFILAQAMFALGLITRLRAQLATLVGFAAVIAALLSTVAVPVLHLAPVGVTTLTLVLVVLSMAVSIASRALTSWLGTYGITIATLAMTAVGLSTSGGILSPDLLPPPLAALGAVLPPGLGLRAIVSLSYFHGAGALRPLLGLVGWIAAGLFVLWCRGGSATGRWRWQAVADTAADPRPGV